MIPKIIHYCWFGDSKQPNLVKKCIRSWKKYCKGYELVLWNEKNFDIESSPEFVKEAYRLKKWAFVTDYVRLKVIYEHGGIYLDTDVELLKPLDELLEYKAFFGYESADIIATGLGFGSEERSEIVYKLMADYSSLLSDCRNVDWMTITCPLINKHVFQEYGFNDSGKIVVKDGIACFPQKYFCPVDSNYTYDLRDQDTYSVHHYSASWFTKENRKQKIRKQKTNKAKLKLHHLIRIPNRIAKKMLGEEKYELIKKKLKRDKTRSH